MFKAYTLLAAIIFSTAATLADAGTVERATRIEIDTQIDIPFSATEVWEVLADIQNYPQWNPYHVRVDGELVEGEKLEVEIHKPNDHQLVIHPRVLTIDPERSLVWGGGVPGIFRGVHRFDFKQLSESCTRLHHTDVFAGLFVSFAELGSIERGYADMNDALASYLVARSSEPIGRC